MRVGRTVAAAGLVLVLLAGCGKSTTTSTPATSGPAPATTASGSASTCPTTETVNLAKTKFVLHAGLASGAFYHWIYQPFRSGAFRSGGISRLGAIVKAGLAAAFVVHELRQAKVDAAGDPTLCKVVIAPLVAVDDAIGRVVSRIRGGDPSASDLNPVDQGFTNLKQQSASSGAPVTDQTPTAAQLANPSSTGG